MTAGPPAASRRRPGAVPARHGGPAWPAGSGRPRSHAGLPGRLAWTLALVGLALWLLHPMASPVHVEGFSASIQSIAMHWAEGNPRHFDSAFPFDLEFFATSRLGTNLLLAGLYRIAPDAGEWPLRIGVWLGLAGLTAASVRLIRQWAGVGTLAALGAVLLMPGVAESAFFYNDNMLSAALATTSIALIAGRDAVPGRPGLLVLGGLAFGAAVLVRADAVLLGPAVLLCLAAIERRWRPLLGALATFGLAAGAVVLLVPAALGFSFLDIFDTARHAVALWQRDASVRTHARVVVLFIGLPGAMLAALGLGAVLRARDWARLLMLAGVPLVYNLAYLGKLWEIRQALGLTPFLGALVALGGLRLFRAAAARPGLRAAALGALALALALPAWPYWMMDGPRTLLGRLWTPVLWDGWQDRVRADLDRLQALAQGLGDDALLVTDEWSADRYMHLSLQRAGFHVADAPAPGAASCGPTVEVLRRGSITVRHLRLHTPFMPRWHELAPVYLAQYLSACGAAPAGGAYYVTWADRMSRFRPGTGSPAGEVAPALGWLHRLRTVPLDVQHLDANGLAALQAALAEQARGASDAAGLAARAGPLLEQSRQSLAARLGLFRDH